MNGRIRRRGKGSWELTIDIGRDAQGKRLRKFVNVKGRKADAERRLREVLASLDAGLPVSFGRLTTAEYLRRWLDTHGGNLRPSTLYGYKSKVDSYLIPALGHLELRHLQPIQVQELEHSMLAGGLSRSTVRQTHRILNKALKDAVKWGVTARNIAEAVTPPPKSIQEMHVLTPTQLRVVLEAKRASVLGNLYHLAAYTGLRRGELVGLQWSDLDLEQG